MTDNGTVGRPVLYRDRVTTSDGGGAGQLESIVLRELRDDGGLRHLSASQCPDGRIIIEGRDLGPGVERIFGALEYEWAWTIGPDAIAAAIEALDGRDGDDPLRVLAAWSTVHGGMDPGSHLQGAGVPIEFWSRMGD